MKSTFLQLNTKDIVKALILTFITSLLTGIYQIMETGTLLTWVSLKPVVITAIASVVGYLAKNVFTNSEDKFMAKEPKTDGGQE